MLASLHTVYIMKVNEWATSGMAMQSLNKCLPFLTFTETGSELIDGR
jgi:hypothetical protein